MLCNGFEDAKSAATNTQHVLTAAHERATRVIMRTLQQSHKLTISEMHMRIFSALANARVRRKATK